MHIRCTMAKTTWRAIALLLGCSCGVERMNDDARDAGGAQDRSDVDASTHLDGAGVADSGAIQHAADRCEGAAIFGPGRHFLDFGSAHDNTRDWGEQCSPIAWSDVEVFVRVEVPPSHHLR